eukprot:g4519.t1
MVQLKNLPVPQTIWYCADTTTAENASTSCEGPPLSFRTISSNSTTELRFYATADVGDPVSHPWTAFPQMAKSCDAEKAFPPVDLAVHVGDIAYNLDIVPRGDDYLAGVSPSMASVFPWMVVPGNHEADCNYTYANYIGRFRAQNLTTSKVQSGSSRFYSFDRGPVHFVGIDTDAYGFDEVAYVLRPQYEWLERDLASVDRTLTPWVILMGHRPMYCSSAAAATSLRLGWPKSSKESEGREETREVRSTGFLHAGVRPPQMSAGDDNFSCGVGDALRNGMVSTTGEGRVYGLEPLMRRYGVQVYLTGHEHNYERTYPIWNGTFVRHYESPGIHVVHVLTGAGGAYGKDPFTPTAAPFDAFRSNEWCYSDIYVNRTHFFLRQKLATNGTIIDSFILTL